MPVFAAVPSCSRRISTSSTLASLCSISLDSFAPRGRSRLEHADKPVPTSLDSFPPGAHTDHGFPARGSAGAIDARPSHSSACRSPCCVDFMCQLLRAKTPTSAAGNSLTGNVAAEERDRRGTWKSSHRARGHDRVERHDHPAVPRAGDGAHVVAEVSGLASSSPPPARTKSMRCPGNEPLAQAREIRLPIFPWEPHRPGAPCVCVTNGANKAGQGTSSSSPANSRSFPANFRSSPANTAAHPPPKGLSGLGVSRLSSPVEQTCLSTPMKQTCLSPPMEQTWCPSNLLLQPSKDLHPSSPKGLASPGHLAFVITNGANKVSQSL